MTTVQPQTVSPATYYVTGKTSNMDLSTVPTGAQGFFGRPETGARVDFVNNALQITMDYIKARQPMSRMVPRQVEGGSWSLGPNEKAMTGQKFTNVTRVFPEMKDQGFVEWNQLFNRIAGENPFDPTKALVEKAREILMEITKVIFEKQMRRNEKAAMESLVYGRQTLDNGEYYDYLRAPSNTFASPLVFSNTSATPIQYIDLLCDAVRSTGLIDPDWIAMGIDVFPAFLDRLAAIADIRNYKLIVQGDSNGMPPLAPKYNFMIKNGWKYAAHLLTYKQRRLPILVYDELYQVEGAPDEPYFPVDVVMAGWTGIRCDKAFGPRFTFPNNPYHEQALNAVLGFDPFTPQMPTSIKNPGVFDARMFHIDGRMNEDNDAINLRIASGGIYNCTGADNIGTMTGCI